MRLIRYTCAAALLALGGCDSSTSSDPPGPPTPPATKIQVALTGTPGAMVAYTGPDGRYRAECPVALVGTATGKQGSAVRWQGGRMLFHFGMSRTAASDTTPLSVDEVARGWGTPEIAGGATQNAQWKFYASAPFKVTVEMGYLEVATGATGTASYTFTCGPTPPAAGAPTPVVSNVSVRPAGLDSAATTVVPGRMLTISYEAESALGVWESGILITGAFSARVPVREASSGVHGGKVYGRAEVMVPADAKGGLFQVQAYAIDPFLNPGTGNAPAAVRVVSNVPPVLEYAFLSSSVRWNEAYTRLVGQYAEGDTMDLVVQAADSRNAGWLIYTLGGAVTVRDSVPVPATSGRLEVKIPVRTGWVGANRFTVQLLNDEQMYSATAVSHPDSFSIVGARTLPYRSAAFATPASDMVLDETRGLLYVALPGSGRVEVLSLATMASTRIEIAPAGYSPAAVDLTRGRDTLLAALPTEGAIAVVDLARPEGPHRVVPVAANGDPLRVQGVRVAANGKVMVWGTVGGVHGAKRVVEMTSSGGGQRTRADAVEAGAGGILGRSQDRGRLFFEGPGYYPCTLVYDSRTDVFGPCFTALSFGNLSSTPTGSRFARRYEVFDVGEGMIRSFTVAPGSAHATGLAPDGLHLYAGLTDGLAKLRVSDGEYVERIPLPEAIDGQILFAGPRRLIALAAPHVYLQGPSRVYVVDLP